MPQTDFNQQQQLAEARRLRRLAQRRRQRIQIRLVLFVLLIIAVLSTVLILRSCRSGRSEERPTQPVTTADRIVTEPDTTITIAAVGDIMIDDALLSAAQTDSGNPDFSSSLAAVAGLTASADLTLGNLELNFAGEPYGSASSSAPEALAAALADAGFDVLQTANSASIQDGLSGLQSTIRTLDTFGLAHVGTYAAASEKSENEGVLLTTVSGLKVAILGYTKGLGGLALPEGAEYAVDLLYQDYATDFDEIATEALERSVQAAKALQPDVILAMLHWGSESDRTVTRSQQRIAELLFENGVDAIIGTHSHMVGPMETQTIEVDGKEKTVFVAYSLGNFYSTMDSSTATNCRDSVVLNLSFTKNGETGETALSGVSYTPIYFADHGEEAETRYEILPVRTAIMTNLFPELNTTMTDTIAHLRTYTESDFDSGK